MERITFRTDPVEQEPLHHFMPGTRVLRVSRLPKDLGVLVGTVVDEGAGSVVVPARFPAMHELARLAGLRGVGLVASCMAPELPSTFPTLRWLDALVLQLPSFDHSGAEGLFDGIRRLLLEGVWMELVCSVGPQTEGDHPIDELAAMLAESLGPDLPLHLVPLRAADEACCEMTRHARWIAQANGLHWVYGEDPADPRALSSWCPGCDALLADRSPGAEGSLLPDTCPGCGWSIPGRFPRLAGRRSSHSFLRVLPPGVPTSDVAQPELDPARKVSSGSGK